MDQMGLTFNGAKAYAFGTKAATREQVAAKVYARKRNLGSRFSMGIDTGVTTRSLTASMLWVVGLMPAGNSTRLCRRFPRKTGRIPLPRLVNVTARGYSNWRMA